MTDNNGSQDAVVIERTLDAPVDLIWQMWTKPEHFQAWYGPTGAKVPVANLDVQVGGTRLVCMEMETPERPDADVVHRRVPRGGRQRTSRLHRQHVRRGRQRALPADMGMPEGHPETTEVIVQLEDLGGSTKMVMTHVGVAADSGAQVVGRWRFDKLEAHVVSVRA